jgi:hypothetical protein
MKRKYNILTKISVHDNFPVVNVVKIVTKKDGNSLVV